MNKISVMFFSLAVLTVGSAQAALWTEDFSSPVSYTDVAQGAETFPNGDVYPADLAGVNGGSRYGVWGLMTSSVNAGDNGIMTVNTTASGTGNMRGAGVILGTSQIGTGADGTLSFDLIDVDNAAGTTLFVEVWQAKDGTSPYYLDLMAPSGTAPAVKSWGDATFTRLAGASYTTAQDGTTPQIAFTRLDTSADLVIMFGTSKASTTSWWNSSDIDNISVNVIPEPATFGMVTMFGGAMLMIRRKFRV